MPFLAPVAATALGTFLVNFAVNAAISIGLSLLVNKLTAKKQKKATATTQTDVVRGAVLELEYGADNPRVVAIGKCAARGLACYDNSFGTANKRLQRVYKLSDFLTTALTRVAINGEWVTLGSLDATLGYPVSSGEYAGLIWVKFRDGRQTTADSYLTGNANPASRWGTDHKGIGLSYVIVTLDYHEEKLTTVPEFVFEFTGAPLYDWRLDSTVGGSGSHRFNDVTTWAYSANPIVADYNYRRGFYTGTYGSGEDVFCGMAMPFGDLDLTRYTAAANICDEDVSGEDRYVVSIFLDAAREHGDNIEDLMVACAGMVVDAPTGAYPILGAAQTPVATLTNDDLVADADVTFTQLRSESELVNSVSGTYAEPSHIYAQEAYAQQTSGAAVALDRRTLDFNLNFPQVPSKRQAEQLASIYFNENRFEAQKVCTLRPKWQRLEIGDWITWEDDEDGEDRDYQVVAMTIASIDAESPRVVQVTLQERHADIYAGIGVVTAPFTIVRNDPPVYLSEVANFALTALLATGENGERWPVIRAAWDAIADPTVDSVLVEYRPKDAPTTVFRQIVPFDQTGVFLQEGVVSRTVYEVRTQLVVSPYRVTVASAWSEITTLNAYLPTEFEEVLVEYRNEIDRLRAYVTRGISESLIETAASALARRVLSSTIDGVSAAVVSEQAARVEGDTALASALTLVDAKSNAATASGLVKLEATASPAGVSARFGIYLRASVEDSYDAEAAEFLEVLSAGGTRKVISADQFVVYNGSSNVVPFYVGGSGLFMEARFEVDKFTIWDGANNVSPFYLDAGVVYIDNARIKDLEATNIKSGSLIQFRTHFTATVTGIASPPISVIRNTLASSLFGCYAGAFDLDVTVILSTGGGTSYSVTVTYILERNINGAGWVTAQSLAVAYSRSTGGSDTIQRIVPLVDQPGTILPIQYRQRIAISGSAGSVQVGPTRLNGLISPR